MDMATTFQGKGEKTRGKGKGAGKEVPSLQDNRTRRRFKVSVGTAGQPGSSIEGSLGKATAATESRTIEISWKGKRCQRQVRQRLRKERQVQGCGNTCLESSKLEGPVESSVAPSAPQTETSSWVRLTRLNAQRWICVQPRWHSRRS